MLGNTGVSFFAENCGSKYTSVYHN